MEPRKPHLVVFNPRYPGQSGGAGLCRRSGAIRDQRRISFVATSYRLTEHFHYWTKHNRINAALQPEFFVELSAELAAEKGIRNGHWVRVWSKRGSVKAKAMVTSIKPMQCGDKTVHCTGIPCNWSFYSRPARAGAEQPDALCR